MLKVTEDPRHGGKRRAAEMKKVVEFRLICADYCPSDLL